MMSLAPLALVGPSTSKMFTLNASGTKPAGLTQLMIGVVFGTRVIGAPSARPGAIPKITITARTTVEVRQRVWNMGPPRMRTAIVRPLSGTRSDLRGQQLRQAFPHDELRPAVSAVRKDHRQELECILPRGPS